MKARNALPIYGSAGHFSRSNGTDLDGECSSHDRRGEHPPRPATSVSERPAASSAAGRLHIYRPKCPFQSYATRIGHRLTLGVWR